MKVVIALDSFKGCLGSAAAGAAVARGVLAAAPSAEVTMHVVADGGEGTLAALLAAGHGREVWCPAVDALGRPIVAPYLLLEGPRGRVAVLEAAATTGLATTGPIGPALPPAASSYGLGMQLDHAVRGGAAEAVVTLGGTASTDGGAGMLQALGARLGNDQPGAGAHVAGRNPLWSFTTLKSDSLPTLEGVLLRGLADVTNPMTGPTGAAATFGPQKGATPEQVDHLETQLQRWAASLEAATGRRIADQPGAGAAGGLGGALLALGGVIEPGFQWVARHTGLADSLRGADLVITGEGSLDAQTAMGKVPAGVATLARAGGNAVVVALAGRVTRNTPTTDLLIDARFPIHSQPRGEAEAMDPGLTEGELTASATEVTRLFLRASHRVGPWDSAGGGVGRGENAVGTCDQENR